MTVDWHTHIVHSPARYAQEEAESLQALLHVANVCESEHVRTRFVKFWLEVAPLLLHLTQSDLGRDGSPDEEMILMDWDTLMNVLVKYDAKGYTCKIHCAGEGRVRRALDVLEKVREENADGPNQEVAHYNAVHEGNCCAPIHEERIAKVGSMTALASNNSESRQRCLRQFPTPPRSSSSRIF